MRAVVCHSYGPPEDLVLEDDVADPVPGPGQLVVRVHAAALNFPDVLLIAGSGTAPRFDQFSVLNSWIKPNIYHPFSVTGGPSALLAGRWLSRSATWATAWPRSMAVSWATPEVP